MKINGNLTLNDGGNSELQNFIIERVTDLPSAVSAEKGRIVFHTTSATYYYNNGTVYMAFATGGNAASLQTEVDNLELALGGSISAAGTYVSGQFTGYAASATTVTQAINMVEAALAAHNTLDELDDVTSTSATTGQFLKFNGSQWVNHTIVLTDVSDVTSTAAEVNQLASSGIVTADLVKIHAVTSTSAQLNILTGATLSTTELNYVTGVTSAIQTQLNNKQPLDDQLTSIAALLPSASSQFLLGGVGGVYSLQDDAGFRTSLGVAIGVNVQAFDPDLATVAGFAPAADSSETLTINTTSITHSGINDIMVGTGGIEGSRWTLERGATARTSLGLGNIAIMDEAHFIRANAASSNIANDIAFNGYKITNLAPGVTGTDAINLNQMQSFIAGLSWKDAVVAASVGNLTLSGEQTVDGVAVVTGNRVLVKNQTLAKDNGIYVVSTTAWTRTTDFNALADSINSAAIFVQQGATQNDTGWTQTAEVAVFGTDDIIWTQFNGAAGITAGIGLAKVGNTLNVNLGAGIVELPSDDVGIDLYDPTSSAIILTENATGRSTATNAKLHLLLDLTGNGKLVQSAAGLRVATDTITPAELTASVAGNGLIGGNGTALAVVSHAGTGAVGGDLSSGTDWDGVALTTITADSVGVTLGSSSTTAAPGNHTHKASAITFDNTVTGGSATTVQAELVVLDGRIDTIDTNAGNLLAEVNLIEAAVGLNTDGTLAAFASTNYIDGLTIKDAEIALDTTIKTLNTTVNNRIGKMYYLHTAGAATTWTVVHSLGQQFVNVTVCDAGHSVIIPQSIVFTDANTTTITFNVAVAGKAIIMGLA